MKIVGASLFTVLTVLNDAPGQAPRAIDNARTAHVSLRGASTARMVRRTTAGGHSEEVFAVPVIDAAILPEVAAGPRD